MTQPSLPAADKRALLHMRRCIQVIGVAAMLYSLGACNGETSESALPPPVNVDCKADDGVTTRGVLYRTGGAQPPGIVLVHAMGAGPEQWVPFARRAQQSGIMCLALTMRGHGPQSEGARPYRQFTPDEWLAVLKDIRAAMNVLRAEGADPENLALGGASIGANLALRYAVLDDAVQAVVMVSPGLDYGGVKTESAIVELGRRPVLLVTTKGDAYAASSCATLKASAAGLCEFRQYEGAAHGTDILATSPNSVEQVLLWLEGILVKQAGA